MSRRRPPRAIADEAPQPDPCPGPCNHAWRDAEELAELERANAKTGNRMPESRTVNHGRKPRLGAPVWCVDVPAYTPEGKPTGGVAVVGCASLIRADLAAIPDLATYLAPGRIMTPRDTVMEDGRAGGTARSAATFPTNSPAWDMADDLIRWACGMADALATHTGYPQPPFTRLEDRMVSPSIVVTGAVSYLLRNFDALMASPSAAACGRGIRARHRALERIVGADRLTHHIAGECPHCHRRGRLYRKDGDDLVRCGACPAVWDWDHFTLLVRTVLQPAKVHA